jgi:hypothetical protein
VTVANTIGGTSGKTVVVQDGTTLEINSQSAKCKTLRLGDDGGIAGGSGILTFSGSNAMLDLTGGFEFGNAANSSSGEIHFGFNNNSTDGALRVYGNFKNNAGTTPVLMGYGNLILEGNHTFNIFPAVHHLTVKNGDVTLDAPLTINGNLYCSGGSLFATANSDVNLIGHFINNGVDVNNNPAGTKISLTEGTFRFGGTNQNMSGNASLDKMQFNRVVVESNLTSDISFAVKHNFTVNGKFTPMPHVTSRIAEGTGMLNGTGTVYITRANGFEDFKLQYGNVLNPMDQLTLNFNGNSSQSTNQPLSNVKSIVISNTAGNVRFTNVSLAPNGTFEVKRNAVVEFDPETGLSEMSADATLFGEGKVVVTSSDESDDFTKQYNVTHRNTSNLTVEFAGFEGQSHGGSTFSNLIINNYDGLTLTSGTTVSKSLILGSGMVNNAANLTLSGSPAASIHMRGGSLDATPNISNVADIFYENSNTPVVTTGNELVLGKVRNLTVNITGGYLNLAGHTTIAGSLIMQRGLIKLCNFNLTAGTFATPATNSYVQVNGTGRLATTLGKNGSALYPIGTDTYNPIKITVTSFTTNTFSVGVSNGVINPVNNLNYGTGIVERTWDVNSNGAATLNVEMFWNASQEKTIGGSPRVSYREESAQTWTKPSSASVNTLLPALKGLKNTNTVSLATAGNYKFCVQHGTNANVFKGIEVDNNINEGKETATISVYPNPAVSNVTVNLNGVEAGQMARITIMDLAGKVIMTSNQVIEGSNFNADINVSQLSKGNYIVNVTTATSNMTSKLIKL